MKRYVWVVEMRHGRMGWIPCAVAWLTKAAATRAIRRYWRSSNPDDKFRAVRYWRKGG
jgi:hypothetical protein